MNIQSNLDCVSCYCFRRRRWTGKVAGFRFVLILLFDWPYVSTLIFKIVENVAWNLFEFYPKVVDKRCSWTIVHRNNRTTIADDRTDIWVCGNETMENIWLLCYAMPCEPWKWWYFLLISVSCCLLRLLQEIGTKFCDIQPERFVHF